MGRTKDPPDKYTVLKVPLSQIIDGDIVLERLTNASIRLNKLIVHAYQFLELWILHKYHNNKPIPEITEDIIQMLCKALTLKSSGPNPKGINKQYHEEFLKFYETNYKKLGYHDKISGKNLSQMLVYTATSILTGIENNIKNNFMKYIQRFINNSHKETTDKILAGLKGDEKELMKKQLKAEINSIKDDIINNTLNSDPKYHKWINLHRSKILPLNTDKLSYFDINGYPQQFIPCMIYINKELEKLNTKLYQVLPLRKSIIPHYVPIDTKSLIELLIDKDKNEYLRNITKYQDKIWKMFFKMNSNIFKMKNYTFNHYITTDCYSVSIHFINNKYVEDEKKKK